MKRLKKCSFQVSLLLVAYSDPYPIIEQFEGEDCYYDPRSKTKKKFPSINDPPSVAISVIVPAYNEEERCKVYVYLIFSFIFII